MGQECHPQGSQAGGGVERTQGPCLSFLEAENLPSLWGDQGQVERALANCVGEASQPAGRAGLRVLGARAGRRGVGIDPAVTKPGSERAEWELGTYQASVFPSAKAFQVAPSCSLPADGPCGCSTQNGLWRAEAARLSQGAAESGLSTRRCQPSAPHLTHPDGTDGPLVPSLWSPNMDPALSHRQLGPLLQGRHWEMGAPMLGKAGTGHKCAGQGCPSNHNTQENAKPAPRAYSTPCPARGCKLTRLPTLGSPAPQVSLCPVD